MFQSTLTSLEKLLNQNLEAPSPRPLIAGFISRLGEGEMIWELEMERSGLSILLKKGRNSIFKDSSNFEKFWNFLFFFF